MSSRRPPSVPAQSGPEVRLGSEEERVVGAWRRAEWHRGDPDFWWRSAAGDVAAVFHGFGGGGAGEALARIVRDALTEPDASSLEARAREPIERAQAVALDHVGRAFVASGTMASVAIGDGRAAVAHVGDARVYRRSGSSLELLTRDHTLAELVASMLGPEAVQPGHPNIIVRGIGSHGDFAVEVSEHACAPGDVLALCTKGVWDTLGHELGDMLALGRDAPAAILAELERAAPESAAAIAIVLV